MFFVISFSLHSLLGFALLAAPGRSSPATFWVEFDLLPGRILELLPPPRKTADSRQKLPRRFATL